ncbi:zinc-ribbon domain-containing protein [Arthrobacter sp. SAFR-179]|uniref:zinc-ribbon domain-containing protein n=1 Tax=Arthrobacter sp. SAFR-179 TaxID=3387279 RepID=UPI003F7BAB08
MLLLFGFKTVHKALPGRAATCSNCGAFIHHLLEEQATRFTLFFIPVLTVSRKFRITCTNCGYVSSITGRQKRALELRR